MTVEFKYYEASTKIPPLLGSVKQYARAALAACVFTSFEFDPTAVEGFFYRGYTQNFIAVGKNEA